MAREVAAVEKSTEDEAKGKLETLLNKATSKPKKSLKTKKISNQMPVFSVSLIGKEKNDTFGHSETLNANKKYIQGAMKIPLLTPERELELARNWREKGDENALHELTSAHLRLVISMASKFRRYGLPMGIWCKKAILA